MAQDSKSKVFLISECGVNHNGNLDLALRQIFESKVAGADAAKFQIYVPEWFLGKSHPLFGYASQCMKFSKSDHHTLKNYADSLGIEYLCTPFHPHIVEWLEDIGVKRYKIASRSVKDKLLLKAVAKTGKPVIMSVGGQNDGDIQTALELLGGSEVTLLYCVVQYPTPLREINLDEMVGLSLFGRPFGLSSHCPSIWPGIYAVARGAKVVEYHTTLSRSLYGCDQSSSLEYPEFKRFTEGARAVEEMGGDLQVLSGNGDSRKDLELVPKL